MSALLCLENVSAGYGEKTIVSNVSFELNQGEFFALLGLNGCGKTTLLKAISGLIPLESGTCRIQGLDCSGLYEYERARYISYIPQRHSKLRGITVMDAVMMGFYPKQSFFEFYTDTHRAAALDTLEKMGLGPLAGEDFSKLSEGQKQLVILARTLIQNTPLMLMDEPDSALDFQNRNRILVKIRQFIQSERKAGLVSLHDPSLALAYCDRLILMHNGKIISDISPGSTSMADIEMSLSAIYGGITLHEHSGQYVVLLRGR
jgi:iron complex transport system ATP-binding protein